MNQESCTYCKGKGSLTKSSIDGYMTIACPFCQEPAVIEQPLLRTIRYQREREMHAAGHYNTGAC